MALYHARKYDLAIQELQKVLETNPNFAPAHGYLGAAYEATGAFQQSIAEWQKGGNSPESRLLAIARVYALSGDRVKAMSLVNEFRRLRNGKTVPSFSMALVYVGLGETDEAFAWLEKAYQEHSWELIGLKVDPRFDPLRSDPRFQRLLRRVWLPR